MDVKLTLCETDPPTERLEAKSSSGSSDYLFPENPDKFYSARKDKIWCKHQATETTLLCTLSDPTTNPVGNLDVEEIPAPFHVGS